MAVIMSSEMVYNFSKAMNEILERTLRIWYLVKALAISLHSFS